MLQSQTTESLAVPRTGSSGIGRYRSMFLNPSPLQFDVFVGAFLQTTLLHHTLLTILAMTSTKPLARHEFSRQRAAPFTHGLTQT